MPSTSKTQQRFMYMVHAAKQDPELRKKLGKKVKAAADSMTDDEVNDFLKLREKKAEDGDVVDGSNAVRNRWDTTLALRKLKRPESELVAEERDKWLPAILESPSDPVAVRLASPVKQGILGGLAGAIGGAGLGYVGGRLAGQTSAGAAGSATITGLLAAAVAALAMGIGRREANEEVEDGIQRLPPGRRTVRDFDENPMLNSERENVIRFAALNAAYRGRPLPKTFGEGV